VLAKVLEHLRGDKIRVFKKRRRKGSRSLQGHRQEYTSLVVTGISE
jgi:large subunit ribosomal protein L21